MATQTGRTVSKWVDFIVDDSGGTIRSIPVNSVNGVGLTYDESEVTAFQELIKNVLPGHADCVINIGGPLDSGGAESVGTLSGSHTILSAITGGVTPLTLDIQIGIRHAWESGEPQFGITSSGTSGFLCTNYIVNLDDMSYTATFRVMGGTAPAWGTAAET